MRHNSERISLHNTTGNHVSLIVCVSLPPQVKGQHSMVQIYSCLLSKNCSEPPSSALLVSPPSSQPTQLKSKRGEKKHIAALQVLLITLIKNWWHNGRPQLQRKAREINKRLICCVVDVTFIIQVKVKQRPKPKYANGDLATWGSCTNIEDWLNIPCLLLLLTASWRGIQKGYVCHLLMFDSSKFLLSSLKDFHHCHKHKVKHKL